MPIIQDVKHKNLTDDALLSLIILKYNSKIEENILEICFRCLFSFILIIHLPFMASFYSAFYILITISLMHLFDGNCKTLMLWIRYMMVHAVGFSNAPDVTIFNQLYTTAIKYIWTKIQLNLENKTIHLSYSVWFLSYYDISTKIKVRVQK